MNYSTQKPSLYKSSIQRDMSYDNIKSLTLDDTVKTKSEQTPSHRSSIKSLLTKTFHPLTSPNISDQPTKSEIKQKKRRSSFRNFSQFLKRSHSTNTDLSIIATNPPSNTNDQQQTKLTADLIYQRLHSKQIDDHDSSFLTRSNTSVMCNGSGTALVPISEEENPIPIKQQNRLKTTNIDDEDYYYDNTTRSDSGVLTHQQTQRIAPSLSKRSHRFLILFILL
jgi:hypothetical protein